jgi:hypothetical protein
MAASSATRASVNRSMLRLSRMCKRAEERGPVFRHRIPRGARLPSCCLEKPLLGSTLRDELRRLGYDVREIGEGGTSCPMPSSNAALSPY